MLTWMDNLLIIELPMIKNTEIPPEVLQQLNIPDGQEENEKKKSKTETFCVTLLSYHIDT